MTTPPSHMWLRIYRAILKIPYMQILRWPISSFRVSCLSGTARILCSRLKPTFPSMRAARMAVFVSLGSLASVDRAEAQTVAIDLPAGRLRAALEALSLQAGISIAEIGRAPVCTPVTHAHLV